jgi:hypothetical protein
VNIDDIGRAGTGLVFDGGDAALALLWERQGSSPISA